MRLFSILLALLVAASLYLLVVQRDEVIAFAQGGADPGDGAVSAGGTAGEAAPQAVAVAAIRSSAREIDSVVVVRGRTEAARQVEVLVHHARLWSLALAAPLRPLPRTTRVLAAMCGAAAREAAGSKSYPSDLTIVGIIDHWEPDPPKTSAPSPSASPGAPGGGAKS